MSPTQHARRVLNLERAQNVRDLGGYGTASGQTTQWRRFVRSGDMDNMSAADQQILVDHGVRTVIDLRMAKEIEAAPNVFSRSDAVNFVIHDFWGTRFDTYRSGKRGAPPEVKLADLYCAGLEASGFVMGEIMQTFADAEEPGFAFHCRSGKDRTGLVAALLLEVAGVPRETVCADYALTAELLLSPDADKQIDPNQPGYYLRGCAPETMALTLQFLDDQFGGPVSYLGAQGVDDRALERVRSHLLD